ncbi:hypothetical protein [Streptomyces sp. JH34]|uniref:hypothetical protein n=1 Tax=Streptomyces sp. JH34 TaxID=2793633 RepID=UPI0023F6DDFB|nr:hypothetical protein [Streptomyces sp. JH34]MDF6020825.1 hypothetical protein [Streptomyces sp. JH34]
MLRTVIPALALVAVVAGCSSSEGDDEQRLTEQQRSYCTQLGKWQRAQSTADTEAPDASGYDEVGDIAQDVFLAMRPLRDETVGEGGALGDETVLAINNDDGYAESHISKYCDDAGFETLMR